MSPLRLLLNVGFISRGLHEPQWSALIVLGIDVGKSIEKEVNTQ